jgi:lipoprotein-anchoring transpeptidase ErfK/SrfK
MTGLRQLAGAAALGIVTMSVAANAPQLLNLHVAFQPQIAVRVASAEGDAAYRVAFGGGSTLPSLPQKQAQPIVPDPAAGQQADAAARLRGKIPSSLYPYFDVYLYVSKAASGSLAQHLYVFHKNDQGDLVFEQSFPVSTGRERHEKYFTSTPEGLFQLDPARFERHHYSHTWGGAAMPYAMFLNATIHGRQTGVALHSATVHTAELGSRASGGCVRLPPEKAAELFERFHGDERGMVPVFAYDAARRRTDGNGVIERNGDGTPILVPGYRVLVFIENYDGGPALVAVVA